MNRPPSHTALLVAACVALMGCEPSPERPGDPPRPGCYLLSYKEWGSPPRATGESMNGARAPIVLEIRADPLDSAWGYGREPEARTAYWGLGPDYDSLYIGFWHPREDTSIHVIFAEAPVLFGMAGDFWQRGDSLVGWVSTFSDVFGVQQGTSHVIGRRYPCRTPTLRSLTMRQHEESFRKEAELRKRSGRAGPGPTQ